MENVNYRMIVMMVSSIIFVGAFTTMLILFNKGEKLNTYLVEDNTRKASSRYSLVYEEEHIYISPADAYYDIIAGDISVPIIIDGDNISDVIIGKAQNGDITAINAIKAKLSGSRYRKKCTYGPTGSVSLIEYIGG